MLGGGGDRGAGRAARPPRQDAASGAAPVQRDVAFVRGRRPARLGTSPATPIQGSQQGDAPSGSFPHYEDESGPGTPLFERAETAALREQLSRLQAENSGLQSEAADLGTALSDQTARCNELERINDDLERRLERSARQELEQGSALLQTVRDLRSQLDGQRAELERERSRRTAVQQTLMRTQQELHRMHQRKYAGAGRSPDQRRRAAAAAGVQSMTLAQALHGAEIAGQAPGAEGEGAARGDKVLRDLAGGKGSYVALSRRETEEQRSSAVKGALDFFGVR